MMPEKTPAVTWEVSAGTAAFAGKAIRKGLIGHIGNAKRPREIMMRNSGRVSP